MSFDERAAFRMQENTVLDQAPLGVDGDAFCRHRRKRIFMCAVFIREPTFKCIPVRCWRGKVVRSILSIRCYINTVIHFVGLPQSTPGRFVYRVVVTVGINAVKIGDLVFDTGETNFQLICIGHSGIIARTIRVAQIGPAAPACCGRAAACMPAILIGIEAGILVGDREGSTFHVDRVMSRRRPCAINILLNESPGVSSSVVTGHIDADACRVGQLERSNKAEGRATILP